MKKIVKSTGFTKEFIESSDTNVLIREMGNVTRVVSIAAGDFVTLTITTDSNTGNKTITGELWVIEDYEAKALIDLADLFAQVKAGDFIDQKQAEVLERLIQYIQFSKGSPR